MVYVATSRDNYGARCSAAACLCYPCTSSISPMMIGIASVW